MGVKILGFSGSLRKDSFNKKLVKVALAAAEKEGVETTYVDLKEFSMPIFDEDLEATQGLPENAIRLKKLMKEADGFIISSPEYNSSISGVLKNTIDWASRKADENEPSLECFQGKVAVIMSASPGGLGGLRGLVHLKAILGNLGVLVLPQQKSIGSAFQAFDEEGALKNEKDQKTIEGLGKEITATILKLN